jgi:hypothetical protein
MATIFAANESTVQIDGEAVDGVRSIDYRHVSVRQNVYALGSAERVGMVSGPQSVEGMLRVTSTSAKLNGIGDTQFQLTAQLRHGETTMTVTFDECFLQSRSFELGVGGHGEASYGFTAVRVREEAG